MNGSEDGGHRGPNERTPLLVQRKTSGVTTINAEHQTQPMPKKQPQVTRLKAFSIVLSLGSLIFMQTGNISLLTTISSSIAEDLEAYASVSWFASAYLIAMSSMPAVAGGLCQMFGAHNYALVSSMIFALGVLVTASAQSLPHFLVGRAIAGLGAAANFPVGIIVVIDLTSVERRGLFMGLLNAGFTLGLALGAPLAGWLEPLIGWRAIFWLMAPFIAAAGTGLYFAMPRPQTQEKHYLRRPSTIEQLRSIDYLGVFTLIGAIVLLLLSLSSPHIKFEPIIFSVVLLVAFVVIEAYYATNPIIPSIVLKSRGTLFTAFSTLGMMMARYVVILYTPVYFMTILSFGPAKAGLSLIAVNGGFAVGGLLVGWLHIRRAGSFYFSTLLTFILFSGCLGLITLLTGPATPTPLFLLLCTINGFITGASLNYTLVHLLHLTPPSTHFVASSVIAMFRGFGGSFGSAIGGGIFTRVLRRTLERGFARRGMVGKGDLVVKLLGTPRLVAGLVGQEKEVAVEGYTAAMKALFGAAAVLALVAAVVQAGTGWKEEGRGRGSGGGGGGAGVNDDGRADGEEARRFED